MGPMNYFYLFVCLALFGIGDFLAVVTKARVSSVFAALLMFLFGFMSGLLPANVIDLAGLSQIAKWASAFLVFHMGTMINLRELVREWRTVLLSIIAMIATILAILACIPLVGKEAAVVAIPVMKGGIIATQIITTAAMAKGLQLAAAFAALVYAIHKFVGTPIASYCGVKEAEKILKEYREGRFSLDKQEDTSGGVKKPLYVRLNWERYFTDYFCLAVTAFFAWVAILMEQVTGLSYSIWVLLLGATVSFYEVVPPKLLDRAKTSGFMSMVVFASIIPSMAGIYMKDLVVLFYQMAVIFTATLISTYLCFYFLPLWKIVGSRNLAIGITMANMIGFPATWLVANEIAATVATNEQEKEIIMKTIMPSYVIAGFATVTTLSIVIAGIFEKFL
ncbi:MAG: hypothetical protein P4N59_08750 [Negativicutes bacterium]|nr:hypothetical protein [Negativicutes bacterium]